MYLGAKQINEKMESGNNTAPEVVEDVEMINREREIEVPAVEVGCVQTTGHIVAHVAVGWATEVAGTSTG